MVIPQFSYLAFQTDEDQKATGRREEGKRESSSGSSDSDDSKEQEEEVKDEIKDYLKTCKEYDFINDPLHKCPQELETCKDELRLQAAYLDYIFSKPVEEIKELIQRPVPQEVGTLMLTIVRNKSGMSRWKPKYVLVTYLKQTSTRGNSCKELLAGKKRSGNKKPTYCISLDIQNPKPKGYSYVGKVKLANKKKSNFVVYDDGLNPKKEKKPKWRKTLCDLQFENKKIPKFGTTRVATMSFVPVEGAFLPGRKFQDYLKVETHEIIRLMKTLVVCQSKPPQYNKEKNKFVRLV